MNCHEFNERLQRRLDDRVRPETDRELVRHTEQCDGCRGQLSAWGRVSSLMTTSPKPVHPLPTSRWPNRQVGWAASGLVAAVILMIVATIDFKEASPTPHGQVEAIAQAEPIDGRERVLAATAMDVDPAQWWQQVQGHDWVSQTMPTVRSMQDGVAPLGRTLMRAMTILTTGGSDPTS